MKLRYTVAPIMTLMCGALLFAASASNNTPQEVGAQFSSRTQLVLVPVVVQDKGGTHMGGLTRESFVLKDNGKKQNFTIFEEINDNSFRRSSPASRAPVKAIASDAAKPFQEYTNVRTAPDRPLLIIALDRINTSSIDQSRARQQMVKFLSENLHPGCLVSLVTIDNGGMTIQHDFTEDTSQIIAVLQRLKSQPGISETTSDPLGDPLIGFMDASNAAVIKHFIEALTAEQANHKLNATEATLDGLRQLARAYGGVAGRKSVIWATAGFPLQLTDPERPLVPAQAPGYPDVQPEYDRTWSILADANLAVYPVDVRGLVNSDVADATIDSRTIFLMERMGYPVLKAQSFDLRERLATMQVVADATGGRAFFNTNDLLSSFDRAARDSSAYYILGYYLPKKTKSGWRSLSVQVKGAAQVRTRTGYFVEREAKHKSARNDEVSLAISSPVDISALPLKLKWTRRAPNANGFWDVAFDMTVAPGAIMVDEASGNHFSLQVVAVARGLSIKDSFQLDRNVDGHMRSTELDTFRSQGMTYRDTIQVVSGEYAVRFLVRDKISGRIGTVTAPLEIK